LVVAPVSRRELLSASGGVGGALVLAACGHSRPSLAKLPAPERRANVELLNGLLDAEHLVVAAYVAALPLLSHHNKRAAVRFLQHELDHITALEMLVQTAHTKPHSAKPSYDLGQPRGEAELLRLLRRVEALAIRAYVDAIPRLSAGAGRQTAASILAVEAQHISIIRRNLGLRPVPAPLVAGAE
jgi:hypothetical protein